MLVASAITMHLMMTDCPTDKPNDPSCIYTVAMDLHGPVVYATALCELNQKFINPNIKQVKNRHMELVCWTPQQLRVHKTVL